MISLGVTAHSEDLEFTKLGCLDCMDECNHCYCIQVKIHRGLSAKTASDCDWEIEDRCCKCGASLQGD